jgi:hypothetical protein
MIRLLPHVNCTNIIFDWQLAQASKRLASAVDTPCYSQSPRGYFLSFSTLLPIMSKVETSHKFNHYMNRRKYQ